MRRPQGENGDQKPAGCDAARQRQWSADLDRQAGKDEDRDVIVYLSAWRALVTLIRALPVTWWGQRSRAREVT